MLSSLFFEREERDAVMVYLSSFYLSNHKVKNPNLYPYNVFQKKDMIPLQFEPITVLYGNNGSGKSTILNLIAQKLGIRGFETYTYGQEYINRFIGECVYVMSDDDSGKECRIPEGSCYIKSEDILYEIKKIQQEDALEQGYIYAQVRKGVTKEQAKKKIHAYDGNCYQNIEILKFAQEKYSNGETAMQILMDSLVPDSMYLLDEPEVSLSPQNQVKIAEEINTLARYLNCQFIIASHSPFMLGTLQGKIYNLDSREIREAQWWELENVQYFYQFFLKHEKEFLKNRGEFS